MATPTTNLHDLPLDCLISVLAKTSPIDVGRSALACRKFLEASRLVNVLEPILPPRYEELLCLACDETVRELRGAKNIYDRLASQIFIRDGKEIFWVDRATGGISYMISSKAMDIVWMDDHQRYWEWRPHSKSRFFEVAYLKAVCWFEVKGALECCLHPGYYTVSVRMQLDNGCNRGWFWEPAEFVLSTSDGQHKALRCHIKNYKRSDSMKPTKDLVPARLVDGIWTEYDVGDFVVKNANHSIGIQLSMTQVGSHWKHGLFVDCIIVRPKYLIPAQELSSARSSCISRWFRSLST